MVERFRDGEIDGVIVRGLARYHDPRGWLAEIYRSDETSGDLQPAMAYVSATHPGLARGPHEHRFQTDLFCFLGPSPMKVWMWDNRGSSRTFGRRQVIDAGESEAVLVVIPPGVVHAYRNVGEGDSYVVNLPNGLYRGAGRNGPIDEIRHEDNPETPFLLVP